MPEMRGEFKAMVDAGVIHNAVSIREIMRASGKFTQHKDLFNQMLEEMEKTNRIVIVREQTGGRRIYLNPKKEA